MHTFSGVHGHQRNACMRTNTSVNNVTVTTSATPYANVTTQLIASTSIEATRVVLRCGTNIAAATTRTDTVIELMAGGSGSEYSILGPVAIGYRNNPIIVDLPLYIPAGTRLSLRIRSARASLATLWIVDLYGSASRDDIGAPSRWVAYGLVDDGTANARGTIFTPGSTNAFGSWTSLTTSTTYAHDLWVPVIDGGTGTVMTALTYRSRFAIASTTDAATEATNATVWDGPQWTTTTSEAMTDTFLTVGALVGMGTSRPIYHPRPSGSPVSVQAMCSGTPDTNQVSASILAAVA